MSHHPRAQRGSAGRAFVALVTLCVMLAVAAVIGFLLADINHRRFRLKQSQGLLYVQRGLRLPLGFGPYEPDTPALKEAYAPLSVPVGETFNTEGVFDERADIDRLLFAVLSAWAKERMANPDGAAQEEAVQYVKRLEILPALSEAQRVELRTLRGGVAFKNGYRLVDNALGLLRQAQDEFRLAAALGGPTAGQAQRMIADIDRRLELMSPVVMPHSGVPSR